MKRICGLKLAAALLLAGHALADSGARPVYIYLHGHFSDYVNIEMTEARLRRILPLLEKYRKQHPQAGVSATLLFSGAASQALADRNAKTGIKDLVQSYARRGVVELGYDGSEEPPYPERSAPDLTKMKTAEERWLARRSAAESLLTEARDSRTAAVLPGRTGGLKQMQSIFGEAVCITGVTEELGGDSEFVQAIRRYNSRAIMFGLPDPSPEPGKAVAGFRESAEEFARELSPIPESSPELYWQDNMLRSSDTSDATIRRVSASEGPEVLKTMLAKLDRSKIRIVHVELADERSYLTSGYTKGERYPPLRFAHDHPEHPTLPAEALRGADEVAASGTAEEAAIRWLVEDYFAGDPGSRFVSSTDLKQMTPPSLGYTVSLDALRGVLAETIKAAWDTNTTYPPIYLRADGHYLSLAELFQVLTDAFSALDRTGKLPQSIKVSEVYGPSPMPDDRGKMVGEVTVAAIAKVCTGLALALHDNSSIPMPKNRVPSRVTIGGMDLNAAQFLRLMAEALVADSKDATVKVKMTQMHTVLAWVVPNTRLQEDQGASWTYKPAPIRPVPAVASKP